MADRTINQRQGETGSGGGDDIHLTTTSERDHEIIHNESEVWCGGKWYCGIMCRYQTTNVSDTLLLTLTISTITITINNYYDYNYNHKLER